MTKVMLVDDDASMQVLIEQIVRRGGYDFAVRATGPTAWSAEGRAPRLPYS